MADDRQPGDWYIAREGHSHGPVSWDDLLELLRAGQVSATDFVWREGLEDWAALGTLVGPATPPPAPQALTPAGTQKSLATPRVGPIHQAPIVARRRGGQRRAFVGAMLVVAILAAGAIGYGLNSLTRGGSEVSESRNARADSQPRATAPKSVAQRDELAMPPLAVPSPSDEAPRPTVAPDNRHGTPEDRSPISQQPPNIPPATIEQPKDPAPGATPASGPAADAPPKSNAPPTTDVKPPPAKEPPTEPTPGTRTLFQEVLVARRPSFDVSGVTISQDLQYRVISKLLVGPRAFDGKIEVKQTIYETKLEKSDGLSRAAFEESLRAMRGQELRYTLGKENEIVKFTGPKENRKVVKADGLGGEGFLLSSVMDDDAWKELAQLSFFLPPSPLKRGQRFERKLTHDWGALGAWYGKTIYNPAGETGGEQRIDYAHYLHYIMPEKKGKDLPFEVVAATFKIDQASGSIQWNPKTARISGVTERFVVRGTVTTKVLGQSVEANVEESQAFALRIMDKLPSEKSK